VGWGGVRRVENGGGDEGVMGVVCDEQFLTFNCSLGRLVSHEVSKLEQRIGLISVLCGRD
jgi:hypothetical protein